MSVRLHCTSGLEPPNMNRIERMSYWRLQSSKHSGSAPSAVSPPPSAVAPPPAAVAPPPSAVAPPLRNRLCEKLTDLCSFSQKRALGLHLHHMDCQGTVKYPAIPQNYLTVPIKYPKIPLNCPPETLKYPKIPLNYPTTPLKYPLVPLK